MIGGYIAAASLAASGAAGILLPQRIAPVLETALTPGRATAEFRILNGALAALGIWALIVGRADAFTAVGVVWLGAAAVRLLAFVMDRPRPDVTYWAFFALEAVLGAAAVYGN
jgi:uncharacterized protein DUF4345